VPLSTKAQSVFLAQTEYNSTLKHYQELMHMANNEQDFTMKELDHLYGLMRDVVDPRDLHQIEGWKDDMLSRLRELHAKKRRYEEKISELLEEKPPQIEAFHDQVGQFKRRPCRTPDSVVAKKNKKTGGDDFSQLTMDSKEFHGGTVTLDDEGGDATNEAEHSYVLTQYSTESANDEATTIHSAKNSTGV